MEQNLIFCPKEIFKLWSQIEGNPVNDCGFFFVVRNWLLDGGHFDYWPGAPKKNNLAAPLRENEATEEWGTLQKIRDFMFLDPYITKDRKTKLLLSGQPHILLMSPLLRVSARV